MQRITVLLFLLFITHVSFSQHSVEVTAGITYSKFNFESDGRYFYDSSSAGSFYVNLGYEYQFGKKRKFGLVPSVEFLTRSSNLQVFFATFIGGNSRIFDEDSSLRFMQVGFSPKFRYYLIGEGKKLRLFLGIGPSVRYNLKATENGIEIVEFEEYQSIILGGIYNIGFHYPIGKNISMLLETGYMNDFQNSFERFYNIVDKNRFSDYYFRLGISGDF